ncbi:MAG TPA: hypothetical protein VMT22_15040 [Terriglobales bacterium]|nr:hypothetical protein [Terriglobales bacterium]
MQKAVLLGALFVTILSVQTWADESQNAPTQTSTEQPNERLKIFQSPTPPPPVPPWKLDADKSKRPTASMTQPQPAGGFSGGATKGAPTH